MNNPTSVSHCSARFAPWAETVANHRANPKSMKHKDVFMPIRPGNGLPIPPADSRINHRSIPKSPPERYSPPVVNPMRITIALQSLAAHRVNTVCSRNCRNRSATPLSAKASAVLGIIGVAPGRRLFRLELSTAQPKSTNPPIAMDKAPARGAGWAKRDRSAVKGITSARV